MTRGPIAYLVGHYPTVSHTFIDREISGLRRRGMPIDTYSLHRTPAEDLLSDEHRSAASQTSVVQPVSFGELAPAFLRVFARHPQRFVSTLVHALRLSAGGGRNGLWQLFYFAEAIVLLRRMEVRGTRHVHVHFANASSMVALLLARVGGPGWSWSFTMHGPTEFDDVRQYALAAKVAEARFVACIGDYCRSQLMKLVDPGHWSKLQVVRCGVVLGSLPFIDRNRDADAVPQVLCVGRLVPDKGQRILIDAMAVLADEGYPGRLTFVGDGPDREALVRRAERLGLSDRVGFTGAMGQDEVAEMYAAADVFCLASFAEGIPVVLMEAMASGLPVVTTEIMGVPELVEDGVSGMLVQPGRADAIAAALKGLLTDADRRSALGRSGRVVVEREFDADRAAARMHELLRGATDGI